MGQANWLKMISPRGQGNSTGVPLDHKAEELTDIFSNITDTKNPICVGSPKQAKASTVTDTFEGVFETNFDSVNET